MEAEPFISAADHDAGFKDLEVTFRSGRIVSVRIRALGRRELRALAEPGKELIDPDRIIAAALPPHLPFANLDKLTIESANAVELAALFLAYGDAWQKKMMSLGEKLWAAKTASLPGSDSSKPALALDGQPLKSAPGLDPESFCSP